MAGFNSRVVLITGGARGQGRSHAIGFASQGADVVICDVAEPIASVPYSLGSMHGLQETQKAVEEVGGRCLALQADVRRPDDLGKVVDQALSEFGHIDIACANAGILSYAPVVELEPAVWQDMLDVNLSGVFHTARAVLPAMLDAGYGRIIATASMAGRGGFQNISHYVASKWGVIGFVKSLAMEVATRGITANVVAPTNVDTDMIQNEGIWQLFAGPGMPPTRQAAAEACSQMTATGDPWIQPQDVTRAVLFLADEGSSMITGEVLHVAAGMNAANSA